MAHLKDLIVNGDARVNGDLYTNSPSVVYGTCTTAAATAEKVITVMDPAWTLKVGDIIGIKWTTTNSASNVKFNVNGSGAFAPANNTSRPYTGNSTQICGYANRTTYYMFDGLYWCFISGGYDANDNTYTSGYCTTAAGTQTKGVSFTNYNLMEKQYFPLLISNTNTYAGQVLMNVNSKGAKPVYLNGKPTSSTNYNILRGTYLVYYDGTNYYLRTDGKIPTESGSNLVESSNISKIVMVTEYPSTPDPDTLYVKVASL